MVTSASELIRNIMIEGHPRCSEHLLVEFAVLRNKGQAKCNVRTLNLKKARFLLTKPAYWLLEVSQIMSLQNNFCKEIFKNKLRPTVIRF